MRVVGDRRVGCGDDARRRGLRLLELLPTSRSCEGVVVIAVEDCRTTCSDDECRRESHLLNLLPDCVREVAVGTLVPELKLRMSSRVLLTPR